MKRRSSHRLIRDVYLTDLAVVISTNFYFTIRYRKSINLCLRKPFKVNFHFLFSVVFFFLLPMLRSIYNSKQASVGSTEFNLTMISLFAENQLQDSRPFNFFYIASCYSQLIYSTTMNCIVSFLLFNQRYFLTKTSIKMISTVDKEM